MRCGTQAYLWYIAPFQLDCARRLVVLLAASSFSPGSETIEMDARYRKMRPAGFKLQSFGYQGKG